ncbi:putative small secreted protein [Neofusicoccum parvum]|uniref:Small secreted protein n=3 Tax=Neofusicoccum TaxID=407951 RepID=A0ABR3SBI2_9PEZI|nr:putative small secreted protein [Neofusicoccum parvum UCRNP2]GME48654.1 putative small secreted protein [Neofusicoccum parvum]GME65118.1 putative small secreted protein [Neofusicoccum parvum]
MFKLTSLISVLAVAATVSATLDPATSNTKGKYPASPNCSAAKTSTAIQAAECSHNTRVSGTQTFAIFKTDHQYDSSHGAPYGTCEAYTCTAPTDSELTDGEDYWTFFWNDNGEDSGVGTGCIKSPDDGTCGCENSDGEFIYGGTDCS